jgi:hypothetical protein
VQRLEDRCLLSVFLNGDPTWLEQGPSPIAQNANTSAVPDHSAVGAINSIAVEPTSFGYIVYVGSVNGGVWRTNDITTCMFGRNPTVDPRSIGWTPLTDDQQSLSIGALALDPCDRSGNTVWAGTGQFSSAGDGGPATGLLLTTNGGLTWTSLGQHDLSGQRVLSVVPTLLNGPTGGEVVLIASPEAGVLRSADGGQSFHRVSKVDGSPLVGSATDLIADPNNTSRFYAALPGQGVFRSDDGGVTWQAVNTGISNIAQSTNLQLAVYPGGPTTTLFAGVVIPDGSPGDVGKISGVFQSTDQTTWSQIATAPTFPNGNPVGMQQLTGMPMVADPTDSNVVYVGQPFRFDASTNSFTYLESTSGTNPHPDQRGLAFLNNQSGQPGDNILLQTDDGGIYGLSNPLNPSNSDVWVALNGSLRTTEFYRVGYDSVRGLILGGAQDNGTSIQIVTGNQQWTGIDGGDGGGVATDATGAHYYVTNSNLYRDGTLLMNGAVWIVLNPSNSQRFLTGAGPHVWESFDQGNSFFEVTPASMQGNLSSFAYGVNNPDAAYIVTDQGEVFVRSTAEGTFTAAQTPSSFSAGIDGVVVDPFDYHTAYVEVGHKQVWRTTDAGATLAGWTNLTFNLDPSNPNNPALIDGNVNLRTIELYDPAPSQAGQGVVLVGGFGGVFRLLESSNGPYWSLFGDQLLGRLPNVLVTDLHYVPSADILLAGTLGRGAWVVPNASQTIPIGESLHVVGDTDFPNENDVIRLVRDGNDPRLLDAFLNNNTTIPDVSVSLAQLTAIEVEGLGGNNQLTVDESNGIISLPFPAAFDCELGFDGGSGTNTLTVDASADPSAENVTVNLDQIVGPGSSTICYQNISTLNIDGGSASGNTYTVNGPGASINVALTTGDGDNDTVNVEATSAAGPVTVSLGRGRDNVSVGYSTNNLDMINGAVTVNGGGSSDTLTLDDQANTVHSNWFIAGGSVFRNHPDSNPGQIDTANVDFSSIGSLTANGGIGGSTFLASPAVENLDELPPLLIVNGGATSDSLLLDDRLNPNSSFWNITASSVDRSYPPPPRAPSQSRLAIFSSIGLLVLNSGSGGNTVNVQSTPGGTTTIFTSNGPDTINVGGTANALDAIQGPLTIDGQGTETLNYLDQGTASGQALSYTVTANQLSRTGTAPVTYSGVASVSVIAANAVGIGNSISVNGTAAGTALTISTGLENDNTTFVVPGIGGPVTLDTHVGDSTFLYDGPATDNSRVYSITSTSVTRTGGFSLTINYPAVPFFDEGFALFPGNPFDQAIDVQSTAPGTSWFLSAGPGHNTYNIGDPAQGLAGIQGQVSVNGNSQGTDTLNYLDQGATPGQILSYTVTANQLSRIGTATVSYGGIANVNIDAGNAASTGFNTFYIETTAAGTTYNVYSGSSGVTEYAVSTGSNLDGILGALNLHGQPGPGTNDFAIVSDFLNSVVHTYTLTTGELQRDGIPPILYDGLDFWEVFAGQGPDAVNVESVGAGVSTVVAAPSADTVTVGTPTGGGQHTLQNILDSLLVAPTSSQQPTVLIDDSGNPSTAARTVTFDNRDSYGYRIHNLAPGDLYVRQGTGAPITVRGDGGNETFAFQDLPPNMQMVLDGGGGTNTLDYSNYVGNVTVDLPLGVATGLTGGISNIQNVTGSQGNDLLVGDANANVLTGGTGRNVIIGGAGPDTLDASGASSDNILIGGTTDFDTNLAALDAIFAEWTRTDLGFRDRFSDLTSGTNGAGATPLNQVNGQLILLTPTTVHADSSPDTLIGSNQTDPGTGNRVHNWFFFDFDDTIVNFLSSSDHKTKVH